MTDEVDPYKKPKELLELSPKGLVPALKLKLNDHDPPRALNESTVIMHYLEESVHPPPTTPCSSLTLSFSLASTSTKRTLFPPISDPCTSVSVSSPDHLSPPHARTLHTLTDARSLVHLQSDHINRTLVPAFYRYLQAQGVPSQLAAGDEFSAAIRTLVGLFERAEHEVGGTGLWRESGGDEPQLGWADVMVGPCES